MYSHEIVETVLNLAWRPKRPDFRRILKAVKRAIPDEAAGLTVDDVRAIYRVNEQFADEASTLRFLQNWPEDQPLDADAIAAARRIAREQIRRAFRKQEQAAAIH